MGIFAKHPLKNTKEYYFDSVAN